MDSDNLTNEKVSNNIGEEFGEVSTVTDRYLYYFKLDMFVPPISGQLTAVFGCFL